MKIAVEVGSVADGTLRGSLEYCKALNVDRIILTAREVPGFRQTGALDAAALKAELAAIEAAGMSASTVVYWAPAALTQGGPDGAKLFDNLVRGLDAMTTTSLDTLAVFAGFERPIDPNDEEAVWDKIIGFYTKLLTEADARGIRIATHFNGTAPAHNVLTAASGFRRLFAAVPSANNGLTFCVGNAWFSEGERIFNVIREFAPRIFYVHTRSTHLYWGEQPFWWDEAGGPDLKLVFELLKQVGYTGDLRAEHMPEVPGENRTDIGTGWAIGYMKALLRYL